MKVPQLWQKWQMMMAHTSLRLNSFPQGMLLVALPLTLVLARMYACVCVGGGGGGRKW
jgi:hypothetical protein